MHLPIGHTKRGKMLALLALPILGLPGGIMAAPATASTPTANAADPTIVTLTAQKQPKVQRPKLNRLKATAASKGIPLKDVIADYVANIARTDPAATANWPDGPVSTPDVMIDDLSAVQLIDLQGMAEAKQTSLEDAIERYGYQRYTSPMAHKLSANFPKELSGFANEDDGSVWIGFKGAIPPRAIALAKTLPVQVELRGNLGYTEADLPVAQKQLHKALRGNPDVADIATWYDPRLGAVEALVVPSSRARATLTADKLREAAVPAVADPNIQVKVSIGEGPLGADYDNYIRGGGRLGYADGFCTSNFNLISESGATKRHGTAGHCVEEGEAVYHNDVADGGSSVVVAKWVYIGSGGDIGMYDHGAMTATRTFYWDDGAKRYADARSAGPAIGDAVCKYGQATGRDCGTVTKLNHTIGDVGGQVVTTIRATDTTCWFGDSGGPFYRDAEAYGVLKGAATPVEGSFCAFTPVNRFYNGAKYYVWTR
ncbi:S1 family peptidase [Nonomuraea sp. NPDC049129]|uniref:S1 family peptidase n=1 Tax=Nonomuraea sp. NPDC049129 TaxID=3155272 RepID=UPI0033F5590C